MPDNTDNMKEIVNSILDKQKEQLQALEAKEAVEISTIKDELVKNSDFQKQELEALKVGLEKIESDMKRNMVIHNSTSDFRTRIAEALNSKDFSAAIRNSAGMLNYSFKTPFIKNAIDNPNQGQDVVLPFRDSGIDMPEVRPLMISDLVQWGVTSSHTIDWVERVSKTDGSGPRAEGARMGEGDLKYDTKSTKVKIMSEYMKVTKEALKDISFLQSEINTELLTDLRLLVDQQLLDGDGTGDNLLGILPQADSFNPGSFAASIDEANEADVIRVAVNQIVVTGQGKWYPNAVVMHPTDVAKLDLLKINDGRYIEVPFYSNNGASAPQIVRVRVVENVGIGEGNFLIADFSKAKAFVRDELAVRFYDQNEDDAIRNMATVTANIRLAFRIKENQKKAFVTGDFATAKAALETP